jgi:DNA-binding NarL/FixJ family response regulator
MLRHRDIKVLVVDDHPVVISGCAALLTEDTQVFGADNAKSGLKAFLRKKPDVVLLDVTLPDISGFELLRRILKADPNANVIMFSMNTDPSVAMRSIELGAKGFVAKNGNPRELTNAIRRVREGERYISPSIATAVALESATARAKPLSVMNRREIEVVRLLARGKKIAEIAEILDISYKTVANVTSLLKKKVGARSHADLIRLAIEMQV